MRLDLGNASADRYSCCNPISGGGGTCRRPPQSKMQLRLRLVASAVFSLVLGVVASNALAARIGVLSNKHADIVAADFAAHIPGHTFTAVDVSGGPPSLNTMLASFDAVLLFEDSVFDAAPQVGNVVYQFALAGRPVVLGTFYDQDRSDQDNPALQPPHGWGSLETIDPNTTDSFGAVTTPRTLNAASIVTHPLTVGVSSLFANKGLAAGNQAKPGTLVLATWTQPNFRGQPDPVIALRIEPSSCVMQIGVAPDYSLYGTFGADYGGDFYTIWKNAFDYGAANCGRHLPVPVLAPLSLAALAALLVLAAALARRRRFAR
jgi:hypothetical protein